MASPAKRARPGPLPPPPPQEDAAEDPRALLRRRWELASVLHFLRVFEPVIKGDLALSAEEVETALIANNRDLRRIHIALLEGIPPVNKKLMVDDGWIIVTAKKLSDWWSWVVEGANPFKSNPGKEIETYKQQDAITRLIILKGLCEVRSEQSDAVWYINDELKRGVDISNFRKEKLGSGSNGTIYWCVGDSTSGHRLYKEDRTIDFKKNWKEKHGQLVKPVFNIHWETVATNLDEFLEISEKLCSKGQPESAIGEHVKTAIVPAVEKIQKKKEKDLKRQQQKDACLIAYSFRTRPTRAHKPVNYSYSDYDRTIKEAIKATAKAKESDSHKEAGKKEKHVSHHRDNRFNGGSDIRPEHNEDERQEDAKDLDDLSSHDDELSDYSDNDDGSSSSDGDTDAFDPSEKKDAVITRKRTRLAARGLSKPREGLRRSQRNEKNCEDTVHPGQVTPRAMTKKTTRQRPTPISKQFSLSSSEDDLALAAADSDSESGSS